MGWRGKVFLGLPAHNIFMMASLVEAHSSSPCALHAELLSSTNRAEAGVELAPARQQPTINQASPGCHQHRIPFDEASYPGNLFLIKQDTWVHRKGHCRPFQERCGQSKQEAEGRSMAGTPPWPRGVGHVTSHIELVPLLLWE